MFSIFKRKEEVTPEHAAKKIAIDDTMAYAQQQADALIKDLRRLRERQLFRAVLNEDANED